MELSIAKSIASVSAEIVEVEAMRAEPDQRLGSSSGTVEAMRVAGSAIRAQSNFYETRWHTAEAGLAANTAHLADI